MSLRFAITALKKLSQEELKILNAIERGMSRYLYVDIETISKLSGLELTYVEKKLRSLHTLGLIQRKREAYIGFILTSRGYDCLALNALSKRGVLASVSASPIGVGKESDVYLGLTPGGRRVAVKVHRVGRISFRQTRRTRSYLGRRSHISWLYQSRLAAQNEYKALLILSKAGVSAPEPIDWNRHIVITEYIEGVELYKCPPLSDPEKILDMVISEIAKAYRAGIIHGDLSEYNVILAGDFSKIILFDWPQWVDTNHPSALYYLRRDIINLMKFFRRKYNVKINIEESAEEIISSLDKGGFND